MSKSKANSGKLGIEKTNDFKIQNQKFLLTYKWHLNKEYIKTFIDGIQDVKHCFVCHENADPNNAYKHTHVLIDFVYILRRQGKNACHTFDIIGEEINKCVLEFDPPPTQDDYIRNAIHCNIQFLKTKEHWNNCLNYVGKEDLACKKEVEESGCLTPEHSIFDKIQDIDGNFEKALSSITSYSEVLGLVAAMKLINTTPCEPPDLTKEWQTSCIELFANKHDKRGIYWFCGLKGGEGKSDVASYLALSEPQKYYIIDNTGAMRDFAEIIKNAKCSGWKGNCLILDLPRDACTKSFYAPLESYKNNRITGTKYSGNTSWVNNNFKKTGNIVVVFANFWPQVVGKVSIDRWRLYEIVDDKLISVKTSVIADQQAGVGMVYPTGVTQQNGYANGFGTTQVVDVPNEMINGWNMTALGRIAQNSVL